MAPEKAFRLRTKVNQHLRWEAAREPWNCPPRLEMSLEVAKGM